MHVVNEISGGYALFYSVGKKKKKEEESCIASRTRKKLTKDKISGPLILVDSSTVSETYTLLAFMVEPLNYNLSFVDLSINDPRFCCWPDVQ